MAIDSADLPPEEARALRSAVDAADLDAPAPAAAFRPRGADRFRYDFSVTYDDGTTRRATLDHGEMTVAQRALAELVLRRVRGA